jgi:hypothetical protein
MEQQRASRRRSSKYEFDFTMISLPGTQFVVDDVSSPNRTNRTGDCLYHAAGNSLRNSGVEGLSRFGPRARNLKERTKNLIEDEIKQNEETREAMNHHSGWWKRPKIGLTRAEDYVKIHIRSESAKAWGSDYDLHILALALKRKKIQNRIVTYSKESQRYDWVNPLVVERGKKDYGRPRKTQLEPTEVERGDVVIQHSGNHWSPTRFDENAPVGTFRTTDQHGNSGQEQGHHHVIEIDD